MEEKAMLSLLSTIISCKVQPFHLERLAMIDKTDFGGIYRKVMADLAEKNRPLTHEHANEGILALKQYYAIALLDPNNMHAVSDAVDPFWHAHILHTQDYTLFCEKVMGDYMHHDPLDHTNTKRVDAVNRLYQYTINCFDIFFSYVNRDYFPVQLPKHQLVCMHGSSYVSEVTSHGLLPIHLAMQPSAVYA